MADDKNHIPRTHTSNDMFWPIRAYKRFIQRIEPELYEQEQGGMSFTKEGLTKTVKTKSGVSQFTDIGGNDPMMIHRPGAGQPVDAAAALAHDKGFVYAAVNAKAREVMIIDWRLFEIDGEDHKEKTQHDVLDLLDAVNDNMTALEFKYLISACLDLTGNAYIYMQGVGNDTDVPKALYLMPPDKVRPVIDRRTWPEQLVGYSMQLENKKLAFKPYEVIHIRLPNPMDFFEGLSPLSAAAEFIDNDDYAMAFTRNFFKYGARPAGFLESDFIAETQLEALKIGFMDMHGGIDNMNRIGVLPKGVKWSPTGASPKDMDFKNLSLTMRDRILSVFGVSKTILGTAESDTNRACYDDQTEVLTENGWKKYYEVKDGERIAEYDGVKDVIRLAVPLGKYVYQYKGKMLHFENSKMDIMVTPDHRMWYRPDHKGAKYRIAQAQKLPKVAHFKAAAPQHEGLEDVGYFGLPGYKKGSHPEKTCRGFAMDDWLEFLGYVLSEGGVSSQVRNRVITLYQKKQPHLSKIRACLKRLKKSGCLNFGSYQTPGEDGWRFNVYGAPLIFWMHENIGSYANNKRIPEFVFKLNMRQRRILFDALMVGDGSIDPRTNRQSGYYSTTSHQLADDVQRLALSLGIQSHAGVHYEAYGNAHTCYRVMFDFGSTEQQLDSQHRGMRHEVAYDGVVWCFKTTTGLFVTRRNGKIALQGNTAETADYVFSKRVVKPHMTLICEALNNGLIPRYGDDLYLTFLDPVPEDRAARTTEMQTSVGSQPVLTVNEARDEFMGLGPVEGGDTLMSPSLMQPVGTPKGDGDPTPQAGGNTNPDKAMRPRGIKTVSGERVAFRPQRSKLATIAKKRKAIGNDLGKAIAEQVRKALAEAPGKAFSTAEKDEAAYKAISERASKAEGEVAEAVRKVNADQKAVVLDNLRSATRKAKAVDPKKLFDVAAWIAATIAALTPTLTSLYESEGKTAAAEVGKPDLNPLDNEAAANALTDDIAKAAASYQQTTQDLLTAKINEGIASGASLDDIKASVQDVYGYSDDVRAAMVAKTETFRTTNAALKATWQQSGVVKTLKWYTTSAEPCVFCQDLNGKTISIDSNFLNAGDTLTVGDKTMTADYGDVGAPPCHPNCQCIARPDQISL